MAPALSGFLVRSRFRLSSEGRRLAIILSLVCTGVGEARATTVHDPIHTVLNILQQTIGQVKEAGYHAQDVAKYTEMINKQVQQIQQLTQMVNQSTEALERFGNPDYYTNMLGLDALLADVNKIKSGVGQTIGEVQATANGGMALKNTAGGLYDDLSDLPDRFGQKVQLDADRFKRFGVVQDLYDSYNTEMQSANESLAQLQQEKQQTLQQLNAAGSLVETEKWKAKLVAVQGSLDNWTSRLHASAMKVLVQQAANQNDEARQALAAKQQAAQGLATDTSTLLLGGHQFFQQSPETAAP